MEFEFQSWGIGIATGWFVNWSYDRWRNWRLRKRQAKGDYFTVTYSEGYIDFESRVRTRISTEEILKKLLEAFRSEPKRGDKST